MWFHAVDTRYYRSFMCSCNKWSCYVNSISIISLNIMVQISLNTFNTWLILYSKSYMYKHYGYLYTTHVWYNSRGNMIDLATRVHLSMTYRSRCKRIRTTYIEYPMHLWHVIKVRKTYTRKCFLMYSNLYV